MESPGVQGSASFHAGYAAAALVGAWFVWLLVPAEVLLGTGAMWAAPPADLAQNLTGHLAFQQEPWQWPPFLARSLRWPEGASIALTDSNPLVSVLAKLAAGLTGQPVNLFGPWLALCLVLQPVAAVYAVRSLGAKSLAAALAAAVVALSFPALLARLGHEEMGHINLMNHFLLLFALGWSVRHVAGYRAPWWQAGLLALLAIFTHPFLFVLLCGVFAAPVAASLLTRQERAAALLGFAVSVGVPYAVFALLAGVTGGGDYGYGLYSFNLGAWLWPQRSGLFGPGLPVLDATTGQYEGFTYLGAGGLLALGVTVVLVATGRAPLPGWRRWIGHVAVLLALTAMAASHKVYLGPWKVVAIESSTIEQVMGPVRASGRLAWPAAYLLLLVPLALVAQRLRQPWAAVVLALVAVLQWMDAAPLRAAMHGYLTSGQDRSLVVPVPPGARLLTAVTGCGQASRLGAQVDLLRLDAVRAGMALENVRMSRDPSGRDCSAIMSDALEVPLQPGEVRAYVGRPAMAPLRTALLGPQARCRQGAVMTLCSPDPASGWEAADIGAPLPELAPGQVLERGALAPHLGWGWVQDQEGRFWSNGTRAVLLFRMPTVPEGTVLRLRLEAEGIGRRVGESQRLLAAAAPQEEPAHSPGAQEMMLAEGTVAPFLLEIAAPATAGHIVRAVIRIADPVDPRVRGTPMPVRWAGLRLHRIALEAASPARRD